MSEHEMIDGMTLIERERQRQRAKGYTPGHDDKHNNGMLAVIAASLAYPHEDGLEMPEALERDALACAYVAPRLSKKTHLERLVIAGALIAAELDRQLRLGKCRVCGCTWSNACPGGCCWVEPDLCSACASMAVQKDGAI